MLFEITCNKKLVAQVYFTNPSGCLQLRECGHVVLRNPTANNNE